MNAAQIKKLGQDVWGSQGGLLSVAELRCLMDHMSDVAEGLYVPGARILEVGHYNGLSTCGIVHALRGALSPWQLHTVDAHCADSWVSATDPAIFTRNRLKYFDAPELSVAFDRSETLTAPLDYDVVFYDGDHAEEQLRFTRAVIDSPRVSLFIFDDKDFTVPARCCAELLAAGWEDESPKYQRLPGDKRTAETMTLGVFRRAA